MKNNYSTGYCCGYIIRDGHDWGEDPKNPYSDWAACADCGIRHTNASIASGYSTSDGSKIPDCTK